MRSVVASVLLVVLSCLPASAAPSAGRHPGVEPGRPALVEALGVLRSWDEQRERAWAAADERALVALYAPGSLAGRADRAMLRDYRARGLVVRRMHTQVLALEVLTRTPDRMRLRVLDRVAGGAVRRNGRLLSLAPTKPTAHTLELRRYDDRWVVLSVSGTGRAPHAAPRPRPGR